jgi:catechol 2,3-dioxygenase-like lactoylglutathione lyase family enzyme
MNASPASNQPMVHVTGLDHIVVVVADVERALAFYCGVLGCAEERVTEWRKGEVFFPSARVNATTIIDLFPGAPDGKNVDHFCLVIAETDLQALADSGRLDVVSGPAERFGAQGQGMALYVLDPDGNVVELRHYGAT